MKQIAKFEKVSFDEYKRSISMDVVRNDEVLREEWEAIMLPTRATSGSAGYDFYIPYACNLDDGSIIHVATGIRCKIEPGWFLMCVPKSGLGFKIGMRFSNTCGVIDSDYYYANNEGHIMAQFSIEKRHVFKQGDKFMQGIFLPFGITADDHAEEARHGGFGSTGR